MAHMPDETDPPRRFYGFKPRDFERANPNPRPSPEPSAPADAVPPVPQIDASKPIEVRALTVAAMTPGPVLRTGERAVSGNDVHAMLRENFERERRAGRFKLAENPKRRSRRTRDYWLIVAATHLVLAPLMVQGFHQRAVVSGATLFVYSLSGIVFVCVSATWIMFFVMDDY